LFLGAFIVEIRGIIIGICFPLLCGVIALKMTGEKRQMVGDGDESDHG
jgi:hypothetical protein